MRECVCQSVRENADLGAAVDVDDAAGGTSFPHDIYRTASMTAMRISLASRPLRVPAILRRLCVHIITNRTSIVRSQQLQNNDFPSAQNPQHVSRPSLSVETMPSIRCTGTVRIVRRVPKIVDPVSPGHTQCLSRSGAILSAAGAYDGSSALSFACHR